MPAGLRQLQIGAPGLSGGFRGQKGHGVEAVWGVWGCLGVLGGGGGCRASVEDCARNFPGNFLGLSVLVTLHGLYSSMSWGGDRAGAFGDMDSRSKGLRLRVLQCGARVAVGFRV